jgi:hypothetical protein
MDVHHVCVAAVAALLGLFIFVYPVVSALSLLRLVSECTNSTRCMLSGVCLAGQVALFIFHGASRDSQAGVAAKLSPLVAALTKLLKRKRKRAHPAAVAPATQPHAVTALALVDIDSDDDGAW